MATSTSSTADTQLAQRRWSSWRRGLTLAAAALVLGGLVALGWFWRHPNLFPASDPGGMGSQVAAGRHVWFGAVQAPTQGDPRTLTLDSAQPVMATAPADTQITVAVCHGHPIGTAYRLRPWCTSTEPVPGAHFRIGAGATDQIVVRVASDHPGKVVIHGLRLNYSAGWQVGDETTGMKLVADFTK